MSLGTPELDALLEKAVKAFEALTPEQKREHRRQGAVSFVMGNLRLSGRDVTKEQVERTVDEMLAKGEIGATWDQ